MKSKFAKRQLLFWSSGSSLPETVFTEFVIVTSFSSQNPKRPRAYGRIRKRQINDEGREGQRECVCVHPIRNRKLTVKTKDYGHYASGFLSESSR